MMKKGCGCSKFMKLLIIIGAVNWGLVGLGDLIGGTNLNVVNLILGSWPVVESIVYLLVGIAGLMMIFGCHCKKCKEACCANAGTCGIDKVSM